MAASRKRDVGYHEMKRAAARRASATGGCLVYATGRPASFPQLAIGVGGSGVVPHPSTTPCIRPPCQLSTVPLKPCFLSAEHLVFLLNLLNTSAALLVPCAIMLHTKSELLPGFALTMAVSQGCWDLLAQASDQAVVLVCCCLPMRSSFVTDRGGAISTG